MLIASRNDNALQSLINLVAFIVSLSFGAVFAPPCHSIHLFALTQGTQDE